MAGTLSNYLYNNWYTNIQCWNNSEHKSEKHRNEFNAVVHETQHIVSENNSTRHEGRIRDILYKLSI